MAPGTLEPTDRLPDPAMPGAPMTGAEETIVLAEAEAARRQGNPLLLYDRVQDAQRRGCRSRRFGYLEALALAQMGDAGRATLCYEAHDLGSWIDEDALALRGRLLKDRAIAASPPERTDLFARASQAYAEACRLTGGYFAAINAATMAWAAGFADAAKVQAGDVLRHPDLAASTDFFALATRIEALVLLGRMDEADVALDAALAVSPAIGDRASAYRQLRWIADEPQAPIGATALADRLRPPPISTYTGHMFREDVTAEAALFAEVGATLTRCGTLAAYGSLACGGDILIAEAVLARGAALHVVLPFAADDFIAASVRPGGEGWVPRFHRCIAAATSVSVATRLGHMGHDAQFAHGAMLAMGAARLRGAQLGADTLQLAIWDGDPAAGAVGTAADVEAWRSLGLETIVIAPGTVDRARDPIVGIAPYTGPERAMRAVLFADFAGFSRLGEAELPTFWTDVMGRIGAVVRRHEAAVEARNTWGDALFAIIDGAPVAAAIALDIVEALRDTPLGDGTGGMRIGLHYGPMYAGTDPVTLARTFYGSEVTLAARIEPRVPTGQVYVTEAMAAALAMQAPDTLACKYVGRIDLAKGYGILSAYRLERVG